MGADLPNAQGLVVRNAQAPTYDDGAKTLTRFTEISAVQVIQGSESAIQDIGGMVDGFGLMFGLNLKGQGHVLRKVQGKQVLNFAFGASGQLPVSLIPDMPENADVKDFLDKAFDADGRWVGFHFEPGRGYRGDSLYIQLDMTDFKLKHPKSAHFVPLVAALGKPKDGNIFMKHFVCGISIFSAGAGAQAEDFASTVIAFPTP